MVLSGASQGAVSGRFDTRCMTQATLEHLRPTLALLPPEAGDGAPVVDVVVPVYNEAAALGSSVRRLHDYLDERFPFSYRITVADNGSTDGTWELALALDATLPNVRAVRLEEKGRGRALHAVWSKSDAVVLAYMDVDLSTDLAALLPLSATVIR